MVNIRIWVGELYVYFRIVVLGRRERMGQDTEEWRAVDLFLSFIYFRGRM